MNLQKHRCLRVFCSTFMLTLCLMLLGIGFFVADYNTRRMAFGEIRLRVVEQADEAEVKTTLSANDLRQGEIQTWSGRLWTLLPARWRVAVWITEAENAALPLLSEEFEHLQQESREPTEPIEVAVRMHMRK